MSLIKTIADQVGLGFTGRINILEQETGKFLGNISLRDGLIVFARFRETIGRPSLYHCLLEDLETDILRYAVEPEVIGDNEIIFELGYEDFLETGQKIYQAYRSSKKFRPPGHLRLILDPDFIAKGQEVSYAEFEVMTVISDYSRVSDVFEHSKLLEYQVSNALVSLRQKKAIKVVGKKQN